MRHPSLAEIMDFITEARYSLFEGRLRLCDIRAKVAGIEEYASSAMLKRSIVGEILRLVQHYYSLPELIGLYHRQKSIFCDHVTSAELDESMSKNVLILDAYYLAGRWLMPGSRYPYADVRLLRPIIADVLVTASTWQRTPYPEQHGALGEWYEELAPGGSLYPSCEHLDYVQRFEAFAENIIWDSRDQDYITIRNFPAPPNPQPLTHWWCTQHILD